MAQLPMQITFRQLDRSPALEEKIHNCALDLQQFFKDIQRCEVAVEKRHQRHRQGNTFRVRIRITVPGDEILVSRETDRNHTHEDPYLTVRDAFDSARRQLQDRAGRQDQRAERRDVISGQLKSIIEHDEIAET